MSDDLTPVRDASGRILPGVSLDSTEEEIAEAVARRDALDAANLSHLRSLGVRNGVGPGWD